MATFTVTTDDDVLDPGDGVLSLREALAAADTTPTVADTIRFDVGAMGGNLIVLAGGQLTVSSDVTIDGDRSDDGSRVTISGAHAGRILSVGAGTDVTLTDLVFRDGQVDGERGGAILALGDSLTLVNSTFTENQTYERDLSDGGRGGAVCIEAGNLAVIDSSFISNSGTGGGAISANSNVTIRGSEFLSNYAAFGGGIAVDGYLLVEDSQFSGNRGAYYHDGPGGAIRLHGSGFISRSTITGNYAQYSGGGIDFGGTTLTVSDSTVADNIADSPSVSNAVGGGIHAGSGYLVVRNSTVTGNRTGGGIYDGATGGGISAASIDIASSIVAGNVVGDAVYGAPGTNADISGTIIRSNGHNIFSSDVTGNVSGDLENIAASTLFASGEVTADGVVLLRANAANPAISGADRLLSMSTDQLGSPRPVPSESSPDTGAAESGLAPSKMASAGNDVLTGTTAANVISGLGGHDFIKGLAGNDTLSGNNGGDFLTGGLGKDRLNGGNGIDMVNYADLATAVTVDLRGDAVGDTDTARRGTETDTLTGIEGAVGSSKGDIFYGDSLDNWFQGGGGKDTYTGGVGRDLYDYNLTSAAGLGNARDVITDFDHLVDDIDLAGIDADATVAGNQAFRWVGTAALSGAGEVGYYTADGNTIVRMSTDADTASEGEIQLSGIRTLTAVDFYL